MNQTNFEWDDEEAGWRGTCPRCGIAGFFKPHFQKNHRTSSIDVLLCPNGHFFVAEYGNNNRGYFERSFPEDWVGSVPSWLPPEFSSCYEELLFALNKKLYRSVIALCGILIEAHVNSCLNTEGDKKKSLYDRLDILKVQGRIDQDQFSSATITRLTRKNVVHPKNILDMVSREDALETFQETVAYLEREYKFRSSKALTEGKQEEAL